VAAPDEFQCHIKSLTGILPAADSVTAVEISTDADMVDTDQVDRSVLQHERKFVEHATGFHRVPVDDTRLVFELVGCVDRVTLEQGIAGVRHDRWYIGPNACERDESIHGRGDKRIRTGGDMFQAWRATVLYTLNQDVWFDIP